MYTKSCRSRPVWRTTLQELYSTQHFQCLRSYLPHTTLYPCYTGADARQKARILGILLEIILQRRESTLVTRMTFSRGVRGYRVNTQKNTHPALLISREHCIFSRVGALVVGVDFHFVGAVLEDPTKAQLATLPQGAKRSLNGEDNILLRTITLQMQIRVQNIWSLGQIYKL